MSERINRREFLKTTLKAGLGLAGIVGASQLPVLAQEATPEATIEAGTQGSWDIEYSQGATDQMKNWSFDTLNPVAWPEFPNVDNEVANFKAEDGLEYGMAESLYAQQDERADFVVPARHYRLYTGEYKIDGIDASPSEPGIGHGIVVVNVGEVTASFESQNFDTGFTVDGRYWNGDKLPQAINGVLSHAAHNMLNLPGNALNAGGESTNAGANCSVPGGCEGVRMVFAIISGNELLVKGVTTFNR